MSLPVWECGLKYSPHIHIRQNSRVTPCVGVWIEITPTTTCYWLYWSLPVWECGLKSFPAPCMYCLRKSLPVWECGLKSVDICLIPNNQSHSLCGSVDWNPLIFVLSPITRVTPCVGVWIEIVISCWCTDKYGWSLPVWECGLKYALFYHYYEILHVTPCVGVWIEISSIWGSTSILFGHSLCGSVDWNKIWVKGERYSDSHSLCGSVDWNMDSLDMHTFTSSSLPVWECGLKFLGSLGLSSYQYVTPCVGVWIEIACREEKMGKGASHSLCGSVDWNNSL